MLVYDITFKPSFENLTEWLEIVRQIGHIPVVIVGNKVDLADQRAVDQETAFEWAQRHHAKSFETSAMTNVFVNEAFVDLAISAIDANAGTSISPRAITIDGRDSREAGACC